MLLLFILLAGFNQALAAPSLAFPFNAQVPPVAEVGKAFRYQLAPTTFSRTSSGLLQYALVDGPAWLSFDASQSLLWGSPGASDVGPSNFQIVANDETGNTRMRCTLVVVSNTGPTVQGNMADSLERTGKQSGPTTLAYRPSQDVNILLNSDLFSRSDQNVSYYSTLSDHTPLPSWLSFDPTTFRYSGTTPPSATLPESFDILLTVSDVAGFGRASLSFSIVVSNHDFRFQPQRQTRSITRGSNVNLTDLRSQLFLDGKPIADSDLQGTTADLPNWLEFEAGSLSVSGVPPVGLMSQKIYVAASDRFGDYTNMTIDLTFESQLFNAEIGIVNVTAGNDFNYILDRKVLARLDLHVSVTFEKGNEWLHFNETSLSIYGKVPESLEDQYISALLIATGLKDPLIKEEQSFQVHVLSSLSQRPGSATATASGLGTSPTRTNTIIDISPSDEASSASEAPKRSTKNTVIISVVVTVLVVVTIIIVLALYCWRKRRLTETNCESPKPEISRPITSPTIWATDQAAMETDPEKWADSVQGSATSRVTSDRPPKIEIDLPLSKSPVKIIKSKLRKSLASSLGDGEARILADFERSSWGYNGVTGSSHAPHDSMKIPTEMARGSRVMDVSPTRPDPRTWSYAESRRKPDRRSCRRSGLPFSRRLAGLGHGRSTSNYQIRSMGSISVLQHSRDCSSLSSYSTQATSLLSATPSAFPTPPIVKRNTVHGVGRAEARESIRVMSRQAEPSQPDMRPLEERRQSYIRQRAANYTPFFGAPESSRDSSSSYRFSRLSIIGGQFSKSGTGTGDLPTPAVFKSVPEEAVDARVTPIAAQFIRNGSHRLHSSRSLGSSRLSTSFRNVSPHSDKRYTQSQAQTGRFDHNKRPRLDPRDDFRDSCVFEDAEEEDQPDDESRDVEQAEAGAEASDTPAKNTIRSLEAARMEAQESSATPCYIPPLQPRSSQSNLGQPGHLPAAPPSTGSLRTQRSTRLRRTRPTFSLTPNRQSSPTRTVTRAGIRAVTQTPEDPASKAMPTLAQRSLAVATHSGQRRMRIVLPTDPTTPPLQPATMMMPNEPTLPPSISPSHVVGSYFPPSTPASMVFAREYSPSAASPQVKTAIAINPSTQSSGISHGKQQQQQRSPVSPTRPSYSYSHSSPWPRTPMTTGLLRTRPPHRSTSNIGPKSSSTTMNSASSSRRSSLHIDSKQRRCTITSPVSVSNTPLTRAQIDRRLAIIEASVSRGTSAAAAIATAAKTSPMRPLSSPTWQETTTTTPTNEPKPITVAKKRASTTTTISPLTTGQNHTRQQHRRSSTTRRHKVTSTSNPTPLTLPVLDETHLAEDTPPRAEEAESGGTAGSRNLGKRRMDRSLLTKRLRQTGRMFVGGGGGGGGGGRKVDGDRDGDGGAGIAEEEEAKGDVSEYGSGRGKGKEVDRRMQREETPAFL